MARGNQPTNESLADVLEKCRIDLANGASVADCLDAYPEFAVELETLLPLVVATRSIAEDPDPAYARAARRRFRATMDAAHAAQQIRPASSGGFLGILRRLAVPLAAVLLVLGLSGFGLVQAADDPNILPDSPLYSVKQARENVNAALSQSPDAKASYHLGLAQRRLREIQAAERMQKGPALIRLILTSMVVQTNLATEEVLSLPSDQRPALESQLRALIASEQSALDRLSAAAPRVAPAFRQLQQELQRDEQRLSAS